MYLLDYMNKHPNWQEELRKPPYYYDIKNDGDYYLVKYNLYLSDFLDPMTLEARGSIFRKEDEKWICVCRALDKFGNYNEYYAPTALIDWSKGVDIQEKIDGSIIKLWYDRDKWHVSTNGSIDAYKVQLGNSTFGDVFELFLPPHLYTHLPSGFTFFFELVSSSNRIVVKYDTEGIYYLGARDMKTMQESSVPLNLPSSVLRPKHYTYYSLSECIEAAKRMGANEEGYVVVSSNMRNGSYMRIKIKGDEYLRLHHIRGNGALTLRRVLEMWQDGTLDDYLGAFPEDAGYVQTIMRAIEKCCKDADEIYEAVRYLPSRKEIALRLQEVLFHPLMVAYCFARLDNKVETSQEFIQKTRIQSLESELMHTLASEMLDNNNVKEDE